MEWKFRPVYAHRPPPLSWRAAETVLELDDKPHLLARIEIRGTVFPLMDAEPFIRVVSRRRGVLSWFADVGDDGLSLSGYFAVDELENGGIVEYGYGNRVLGRIGGFDVEHIQRLDRKRLPRELVVVDGPYLKRKRG